MATGDSLFRLTRLVAATDIKLSARCENGQKQILAFVTESGHLTLYYKPTPEQLPVMKIVPWFSDSVKRIAALTFDPSGTWLLVAGNDGTVYIVPALSLVDPASSLDHRWPASDITAIPTNLSAPAAASNCRVSRPTAVAWWQCGSDCQHVAVVGTDRGDIALVSLTAGLQVGLTYVRAPIAGLQVCQDNSLDGVFLLVTSDQRSQWKLLLEQRATGYIWPLDNINVGKISDFSSSHSSLDLEFSNRNAPLPTTRSRLQGLKQLSVEKLASLRQRLAETRVKGAMDRDVQTRRGSNSSSSDESQSRTSKTSLSSEGPDWSSTGPLPERLGPYVGETFLQPQYARGRYLLSGYYAPTNILTIHGMNLEVVPLFVHKLPPRSRDVLVTDRFLFVTDEERHTLSVVSCQLAESRLDGDTDFNPESVVSSFSFDNNERIIAVYKRTDSSLRIRSNGRSKSSSSNHRSSADRREKVSSEREDKTSESKDKASESRDKLTESNEKSSEKAGKTEKSSERKEKSSERREKSSERSTASKSRGSKERDTKRTTPQFVLPKDVRDLNIEDKLVDTCVVVTTAGVHEVMLRRRPVEVFMELVLQRQELEKAERLAQMFALDLQQLFEAAGDLKLADKQFPQAISLYKLSRCRHLKSVLKFAAAGHSRELLAYIGMLLSTAGVELSPSERIHLANLAVMAYADQVLRAVHRPRAALTKQFLDFLRWNLCYDEVLAVNIAGQTGLWEILRYLATSRGLHLEVLDILAKILRSMMADAGGLKDVEDVGEGSPALDAGLWSCVAHPSLLQALLSRPQPAKAHLAFVCRLLPRLDAERLHRLAELLDPSAPSLRPALRRALAAKRRRHCSAVSSDSYASDSVDAAENDEPCVTNPAEEIVQAFLLVLVHLIRARNPDPVFDPRLVGHLKPPPSEEDLITFLESSNEHHSVPLRTSVIGAGFCHAALVRNASVFTWGNAVQGCLGTGPTMSRYSLAQHVALFPTLRVEVLSISCGRQHTLALTNNGVYSWGSSQFGQLGVAELNQSAWPVLVQSLAGERVVAVSAGQYHSLALTSNGRVYSWGWGVHGQLGHRSVEDCREPRLVRALLGRTVTRIAAAHAHSLMLTADGEVLACGSSIFGQLGGSGGGGGGHGKSTTPVAVEGMGERVVDIATNYFHNLALTASNRLYTWGASPQVLRLQAQAQKKARLMQQHCAAATASQTPPSTPSPARDKPLPPPDGFNDATAVLESLDFLAADLPSPVADMAVLPALVGDLVINEAFTDPLTNREIDVGVSDMKTTPVATKKSFTESVRDYFVEQKAALTSSASSGQKIASRKAGEASGTEMAVMEGRGVGAVNGGVEGETQPMCTNVRTASSEGYVLPTIVVSPTIEAKRVLVVKKAATPTVIKKAAQKPPPYLLDDGGQSHLTPQPVDTSLVVGQIVQIACGCHHSALVTKDGTLYTWGRNLDGQLGTGGRREVVIPTPLGVAPPPATTPTGGGPRPAAIANAIPAATAGEKLRVQQVVCGCEFTMALDSQSAKLWAWGCNSHAQLGKTPAEDGKSLDGRTVVIKTVRRVIKLPHGTQNAVETPREVPHLPTAGITFRTAPRDPIPPAPLAALAAMDTPAYGRAALHHSLQRLRGHYDAGLTARHCLDTGDYQAAARLAALERQHHTALTYHLRALVAAGAAKEAEREARRSSERDVKLNAENLAGVERGDGGNARGGAATVRDLTAGENVVVDVGPADGRRSRTMFDEDVLIEESVIRNGEHRTGGDSKRGSDISVRSESDETKKSGSLCQNQVTNLEGQTGGRDSKSRVTCSDNKMVTDPESRAENPGNQVSKPEKRVTSPDDRVASPESRVTTPDSILTSPSTEDGSEIHTFSIQGGNEEMSEGRQDLSSPSDAAPATLPPLPRQDDLAAEAEVAAESIGEATPVTITSDNNCSITKPGEQCSNTSLGLAEGGDDLIKVTNNLGNLQIDQTSTPDKYFVPSNGERNEAKKNVDDLEIDTVIDGACVEAFSDGLERNGLSPPIVTISAVQSDEEMAGTVRSAIESGKGITISGLKADETAADVEKYSDNLADECAGSNKSAARLGEAVTKSAVAPGGRATLVDESEVKSDEEFLSCAEAIVEHFVTETEDDGHAMTRQVVQRAAEFWVGRSLPMWRLERLLEKHMDKLYYPLGLMLFSGSNGCGDDTESVSMLSHLSAKFCLQLCSTLMSHVTQDKSRTEYIELLANAASLRTDAYGDDSFPANQSEVRTPEQLVEAILAKLGGSSAVTHVSLSEQVVTARLNEQNVPGGGGRLFVFSCGHHYSAAELHLAALPALSARLPNTARAMKSLFLDDPAAPATHLACPACVLRHVQTIAAVETPI